MISSADDAGLPSGAASDDTALHQISLHRCTQRASQRAALNQFDGELSS
jgi:hypothetical protein